jgi:hypothetical protein
MSTNVDSRSRWQKTARNEENIQKIRQAVNADRRFKLSETDEEAGIQKEPEFTNIHKDLMVKKLSEMWVPRLLTQNKNWNVDQLQNTG